MQIKIRQQLSEFKHLNVGGEVKVSGDGYVVLYVDELSGGNPGHLMQAETVASLQLYLSGKNAGYNNFKEVNANTIAMNCYKVYTGKWNICRKCIYKWKS